MIIRRGLLRTHGCRQGPRPEELLRNEGYETLGTAACRQDFAIALSLQWRGRRKEKESFSLIDSLLGAALILHTPKRPLAYGDERLESD